MVRDTSERFGIRQISRTRKREESKVIHISLPLITTGVQNIHRIRESGLDSEDSKTQGGNSVGKDRGEVVTNYKLDTRKIEDARRE